MDIREAITQLSPAIAAAVTETTPGFRFATREGELAFSEVTGEGGIQKTVLLGSGVPGGVFAMVKGQDVVFVLQSTVAQLLSRPPVIKQDPPEIETGEGADEEAP